MAATSIAVFNRDALTIETYNPEKGPRWVRLTTITEEIGGAWTYAVVVGNDIYAFLVEGKNFKTDYKGTPCWTALEDRTMTKFDRVAAVHLNGMIYAFADSERNGSSVERYDIQSNSWSELPKRLVAGRDIAVVEANGIIYCIGGFSDRVLSDVTTFDPSGSGVWSAAPPMPTARSGCAATVYGNKIYVMGGFDGNSISKRTESFNITSNQWSELTEMQRPHRFFRACVIANNIYAVGGDGSGNAIESFDPPTKSWSVVNSTDFSIAALATIPLDI